jgi:hypothetical protein
MGGGILEEGCERNGREGVQDWVGEDVMGVEGRGWVWILVLRGSLRRWSRCLSGCPLQRPRADPESARRASVSGKWCVKVRESVYVGVRWCAWVYEGVGACEGARRCERGCVRVGVWVPKEEQRGGERRQEARGGVRAGGHDLGSEHSHLDLLGRDDHERVAELLLERVTHADDGAGLLDRAEVLVLLSESLGAALLGGVRCAVRR